MKKLIIPLLTLTLHLPAPADETAALEQIDPQELINMIERMTGWTAAELGTGLERVDRLYANEMQNEQGRVRWHGKMEYSEIDTNSMCRIDHYADGWTNCVPFVPPRPHPPRPPRPPVVTTNGIPARLAQARIQTVADKAVTNQVTVDVTGNAP